MTRAKRTRDNDSLPPARTEKRTQVTTATRTRRSPSLLPPSARPEFTCDSVCAAARASVEELFANAASVSPPTVSIDQILDGARVVYLTDDQSSWVYHVPGWYKRLYEALSPHPEHSYSEWVDAAWNLHPPQYDSLKMFGKDVLMPRFQQVYGQSYRFSGKLFEAQPFPELLLHALGTLQRLVVHPATSTTYLHAGLVNWYAHGEHYVGPHTDDESTLHVHSPVLSLSLGATRRFVFTPRPPSAKNPPAPSVGRVEMLLHDGDLLVMGGTTQATHKHALPKMKQCKDKRISITLRCFK